MIMCMLYTLSTERLSGFQAFALSALVRCNPAAERECRWGWGFWGQIQSRYLVYELRGVWKVFALQDCMF